MSITHRHPAGTVPVVLLLLLTAAPAGGQPGSGTPERTLHRIVRTDTPPRIDGVLDDPAWRAAEPIPLALEWLPGDNTPAPVETEVRLLYDQDAIYLAFLAHDPDPSQIRAHVRDRDTAFADDVVGFMFDTFDDARRGFQFRVNAAGAQMDASFSELEGIEDWSWDAIWKSSARITDRGYEVEVAIPFSSLRFPRTDEVQTWGLQLFRDWPRNVRHRLRASRTDRNRTTILDQADRITGLQGISPGRNLEFDPTVTAVRTDRIPDDGLTTDPRDIRLRGGSTDSDVGLTFKWGLSPNLIVNGAVNPDFSQVEADVAQLAVNQRFALFFPERRPFFLEAADVFATPLQAVFTRTFVDPQGGLKLTGKEGRHAIGLFGVRDHVNTLLFPANQGSRSALLDSRLDAAVLRYRYDLGDNSTVGLLYTDREGEGYHNRVGGFDGFLRLNDAKTLNLQFLYSDTAYPESVASTYGQPVGSFGGTGLSANLHHQNRSWIYDAVWQRLDGDFRADAGFQPRTDFNFLTAYLLRVLWGETGGWYNRLAFGIGGSRVEDLEGRLTDADITPVVMYNGPWQSQVRALVMAGWESLEGRMYEYRRPRVEVTLQPSGSVNLTGVLVTGGTVDLVNSRDADQVLLNAALGLNLGRRLLLNLGGTHQRLDVEPGRLYTADLAEARLFYHFDVRTYVRAIVQYQVVDYNLEAYDEAVRPYFHPVDRSLFTQLLFSWKLNPQTVFFLGYSDNGLGWDATTPAPPLRLTRTDRTFFLKLGYALVL